jgi:hypothetical protein
VGLLVLVPCLSAQEVARLVVMVWDQTNASVPQAKIILTDKQRGTERTGLTNETGSLLLEGMPAGEYQLEVEKIGFNKLVLNTVNLHARDLQSLQLTLQVAAAQATVVNVTAVVEGVLTDTSTGTVMSGNYAQNLPMASRTVQSLLLLTPGILSVTSGTGDSGIHANGLRSNTNYFMIDGTSANASPTIVSLNMNMGGPGGGGPGRGAGASGSGGSSDNGSLFLPMDAVQEVRVQTSTFAPEFGRSPGAQVSILSRSGTNQMHGSLYQYLRNERMNGNDWFANSTGFNRQKMRQNNYGASLGGAVKPSNMFYFGSYEMLDYWQPSTAIDSVPSLATRSSASSKLLPYLNAFPVPNGPVLTYGAAQFFGVYTSPNKSQSGTLRLDRTFRKSFATFLRYSNTSSDSESRGGGVSTSAMLTNSNFKSQSLIAAATWNGRDDAVNDVRLSVTQSKYLSNTAMDNFGGAVVPADSALFPSGVDSTTGSATMYIVGLGGYAKGQRSQNTQNQINLVFNQSVSDSVHQAKAGFDYRIQLARHRFKTYSNTVSFTGLTGEVGSLQSGYATNAIITAGKPDRYPMYQNFSFYVQDTFKASKRNTVTYGIRWDVNPAPSTTNSDKPVGLDYSNNIVDAGPLYKTKWLNLAPRIGWTRLISDRANRELVFRTGAGIFYDVGYGSSTATFNGPPFANSTILNNTFDTKVAFPLTAANLVAPSLPATRPYGQVASADSLLKAPLVYQWNATLEHRLGMGHMLSVGYVGNAGRRLLAQETSRSFVETEYNMLMITSNAATSDYHGMQVQYRRSLARRIQAQVGYTWSHSLDSASSDTSMGGFALMRGMDRGSSDYDARHVLNVSASVQIPSPSIAPLRWVFGGWSTDYMFNARTGLPFDVRSITLMTIGADTDSDGEDDEYRQMYSQVRPNYLGGPVWIADTNAPGGKKLNLAAFGEPDEGYMGNLGRNAIRGFGAAEASVSLRRQVAITEKIYLHIRAEAFNAFNSPNFANPDPYEGANLISPNFGIVTRMLNRSYGGATSSYQMGGPRSAQVSLRLQF